MKRPRVCIFHNVVAPYRLPLFERLAKDLDLVVLFASRKAGQRRWSVTLEDAGFAYRLLPALVAARLVINPTLPAELFRRRPELLICADNDENMASLLVIVALRRVIGYRLVVWTEHVPARPSARERGVPTERAGLQGLVHDIQLSLLNRLRRGVYRRADGILSMSDGHSDRFIAELIGARPGVYTGTQVMPRSLLPEVSTPKSRTAQRPLRVLFLGYLRPNKNVGGLIEAFVQCATGHEELVIAGSGRELASLERLADGRTDISFVGHVDGQDKASLLAGADVMVVPSFIEPWGLVVNEALFYRLPVIVGRGVAASALVCDGQNGLLFDPETPGELEAQLRRYFHDPQLRAALAAGAAKVDREQLVSVDHGVAHMRRAVAALMPGAVTA
jgi:glycosyltransferase involved in cell wall biosynthesis